MSAIRRRIDPTVILVASREIQQRLSSKAYRIATVVVVILAAGAVVVPKIVSGGGTRVVVGVTANSSAIVKSLTPEVRSISGVKISLVVEADNSALMSAVRSKKVSYGYSGVELMTPVPISPGTTSAAARSLFALSEALSTQKLLGSPAISRLPRSVVSALLSPPPVKVVALGPAKAKPKDQAASIVGLILLFTLLSQYGAWVLIGVIEEKSSRVVEILLSVIKPRTLLIGKVIGIGLVALLQASLILVSVVVSSVVIGSNLLSGAGVTLIIMQFVWLLLGYSLYCSLFAAAGSLVSRLEDAQSVSIVIQIPMLLGYLMGFAASGGSGGTLVHVLAYVPLFSPFLVPVYWNSGVMGSVGVLIAGLLLVVSIYFSYGFAARVYEGGILHGGGKLKVRSALVASTDLGDLGPS